MKVDEAGEGRQRQMKAEEGRWMQLDGCTGLTGIDWNVGMDITGRYIKKF